MRNRYIIDMDGIVSLVDLDNLSLLRTLFSPEVPKLKGRMFEDLLEKRSE